MDINSKLLSEIIVHMKYAKYIPELNRRETWEELVNRNRAMHLKKFPNLSEEILNAYEFVHSKKVLPSMRSMQFAGKPIEINPARIYNCAYVAMDDWRAFAEIMFLLLGGTGVGYSVQKHHIEKLPEIKKATKKKRYLIGDSIEGWSDAIKMLVKSYFLGTPFPIFDFSDIRPKGARLITAGGKAPGAEPLKDCVHNIQKIFDRKKVGDKLTTLEVHDINCYIADAVLSGGIRRAACVSFFSFDDEDMLTCKYGNWWELNPQRARSNNSIVVLRHRIEEEEFLDVWDRIEASKSGEPGIFFTNDSEMLGNPCQPAWAKVLTKDGIRTFSDIEVGTEIWSSEGWTKVLKKWSTGIKKVYEYKLSTDKKTLNDLDYCFNGTDTHKVLENGAKIEVKNAKYIDCFVDENNIIPFKIESVKFISEEEVFDITVDNSSHTYWTQGCNVSNCVEVSLKSKQFCNLVEVNVSDITSQEDLNNRCKAATFIATLQASYTNFHYLRDDYRKITEKDALIGVGMTGIGSGEVLKYNIKESANIVKLENERVANLIGINKSARTTVIKPSGTSSIVLGTSSGIHAWFNSYYTRRIRVGKNEAIYSYLSKDHPELLEDEYLKPKEQAVISIPIKAPLNSMLRSESPITTLERVKRFHKEWIKGGHRKGSNTNNVSTTIYVKDDEWKTVGEWMWNNRNSYNGISVLPYDGGTYKQMPFEDITEEQYTEYSKKLHEIDLRKVVEMDDNTDASGELSCVGGACEIK